ncbi:class I SAM-dependent methyltransferase [Naasia sp. SYSU D00948]|uniref:class I SAM-dependent methyltransferase n=1 Tax=Naasia sp. SYSU D00948 TaxID=2817379 RepID=UPI001B30BE52|nr:class I SAM-dependent methyltransferase [Naasia sp. SYSU D00948]
MQHGWLSCPRCGRDLDGEDGELRCPSGHRFEVGRRGYPSLVVGRSPLVRSEPAAVLDAADAEWGSGRLDALIQAVEAVLPSCAGVRVLDCGSDLGHLVAAAAGGRPGLRALLVRSSPAALVRARARSGAHGVLVDPSRPWPVRDASADAVLCAFADHRPAEFHRVLAPGGVAIIVAPQRQAAAVDDDVYPWFEHDQTRTAAGPSGAPAAIIRFRRRRRPLSW